MTVLDASAGLALLLREPGSERVTEAVASGEGACMSTVNVAEVLGWFARRGRDSRPVAGWLQTSEMEIVPFTAEQAADAADLVPLTSALGLSLGDRACLALARERGARVLTADRAWRRLRAGVEIEVIR